VQTCTSTIICLLFFVNYGKLTILKQCVSQLEQRGGSALWCLHMVTFSFGADSFCAGRWKKNVAARPPNARKPSNLLLLALDWGPEEAERALKVRFEIHWAHTFCVACLLPKAGITDCSPPPRLLSPTGYCQERQEAARRAQLEGIGASHSKSVAPSPMERNEDQGSDEDGHAVYMCRHDGRERPTKYDCRWWMASTIWQRLCPPPPLP
jgi:hypothetical protein